MNNSTKDVKELSGEDLELARELLRRKRVHDDKVSRGLIKGNKKWSDYTQEQKDNQDRAAANRRHGFSG